MIETLFFEIGAVILVAALFSFLASLLRQPLIIAYIIAGIAVGPGVLAITHSTEVLNVFSQIGIAFLLFTVGLGLNWRSVKEIGVIAVATGLGQIIFTSGLGFLIGLWLGFDLLVSFYIAVAFTFSSTIIVVKLLMDKEDLDTLYGKISVGFLLVQDVVAMMILLMLAAFRSGNSWTEILSLSLLKGIFVVLIVGLLSLYVVPRLVRYAAKSQELLLLFALGWCFFLAGLLVFFGFGIEMGALIAGISLSGTIYHTDINARIKPLRDFFLVLFFIVLGTQLNFSDLTSLWIPMVVYVFFVLVGDPLIVMFVMRVLGYHPSIGFLCGTTVAQISEFSFIILGVGVALGHIDSSIISLAAFVGLMTIAVSSYAMKYNKQIYTGLRPFLRLFEGHLQAHEDYAKQHAGPQIILLGYHRMGEILLADIQKMRKKYIVLDYDPLVIECLLQKNIPALYADAGDEDTLLELRADQAQIIISTIPDFSTSLSLLIFLKKRSFKGICIVTTKTKEEAQKCYVLGATYVIIPHVLGAKKFEELFLKNKTVKRSWKQLAAF